MSTVDRILDLIDTGLQTPAPDPTYGEVSPTNREACWHCQRNDPAEDSESGVCGECRAFLLEETEEDPRRTEWTYVGATIRPWIGDDLWSACFGISGPGPYVHTVTPEPTSFIFDQWVNYTFTLTDVDRWWWEELSRYPTSPLSWRISAPEPEPVAVDPHLPFRDWETIVRGDLTEAAEAASAILGSKGDTDPPPPPTTHDDPRRPHARRPHRRDA